MSDLREALLAFRTAWSIPDHHYRMEALYNASKAAETALSAEPAPAPQEPALKCIECDGPVEWRCPACQIRSPLYASPAPGELGAGDAVAGGAAFASGSLTLPAPWRRTQFVYPTPAELAGGRELVVTLGTGVGDLMIKQLHHNGQFSTCNFGSAPVWWAFADELLPKVTP